MPTRFLLLSSCAVLMCTAARAEITVTRGEYLGGELVVEGETQRSNQRITLDDRFVERTGRYNQFAFRVRYLPRDCTVQIKAGREVRTAYISNCEPTGALPPRAPVGAPGR